MQSRDGTAEDELSRGDLGMEGLTAKCHTSGLDAEEGKEAKGSVVKRDATRTGNLHPSSLETFEEKNPRPPTSGRLIGCS